MNYLFGTFHKTGTIWMMQMLYEFSVLGKYQFVGVAMRDIKESDIRGDVNLLFDYQSKFSDPLNLVSSSKGIIVIRHPKDQIISATRYHEVSSEEWLHVPRSELGGMTYQEKLLSLDTWKDKVLFEMRAESRRNTNLMKLFSDDRFIKIKYEDLVDGYPYPACLDDIYNHLNFDPQQREWFTESYQKTHMVNTSSDHIIDGSTGQWQTLWPTELDITYQRIFGDAESQLGY